MRIEIGDVASVVMAVCAVITTVCVVYALFRKKQLLGKDKLKNESLKDIQANFITFKGVFQESRLPNVNGKIVYPGCDSHNLPTIEEFLKTNTQFYPKRLKMLWDIFSKTKNSIHYHRTLIGLEHEFLDAEENFCLLLLQKLELAIKNPIENNNMILRSIDETDDVSKRLNNIISDVCKKCK